MAKAKKEDPVFVGLDSPENVQRNLLEGSKEILLTLKQMEDLDKLRETKIEKIEEMNEILRNLRNEITKLKRKSPSLINIKKETPPEKKEPVKVETKVVKPKTEMEKIEDEIAFIESKLNSL